MPQPEPEPEPAPAAPSATHGTFRARAVMYVLIAMFEMTNCERDQQELCLALSRGLKLCPAEPPICLPPTARLTHVACATRRCHPPRRAVFSTVHRP
jgi:hypothetical protein